MLIFVALLAAASAWPIANPFYDAERHQREEKRCAEHDARDRRFDAASCKHARGRDFFLHHTAHWIWRLSSTTLSY